MTRPAPCRGLRYLHSKLGTRRSVMVLIAISSIFRAITLFHDPGRTATGQAILFLDLPVWLRTAGWAGTAVIAIAAACWAPSRHEWIGWAALVAMPIERLFSYVVSFAVWAIPGGGPGTPYSAAYAGQWLASLGMLILVATWREDSLSRLQRTWADDPERK